MTDSPITARPDSPADGPIPPPGDDPSIVGRRPYSLRMLTVWFMAESLALALLQLPLNLDFASFATMDQGTNLTIQRLLERGLVPTVDFGYQYGLLPPLLGRLWFAVLGRTPVAYAGAMLVVDLVIAWGLARCAHALRAGPAGIALILFGMSAATLGSYINLAHACEAALICNALADHASGRRSRSLALLTVALFAKPVMAYVYGLLSVILIARSRGIRGLVRTAIPAAVVGILLLIVLTARFGSHPVVTSLFPLNGATSYRLANYGFFSGKGHRFWLPDGVTPRHFIFTPAGHYLAGSIILAGAGLASIWRLVRRRGAGGGVNDEIVACCGIMHIAFLTMFYGDFMSYTYYYYILIIGLVALSARGPRWSLPIALLACWALVGNKDQVNWWAMQWRDARPGAETFGLWADSAAREEWRQVRRALGDSPGAFISTGGGCMEQFLPQLGEPEDAFLIAGWPLPDELQRKKDKVAAAEVVLAFAWRDPRGILRPPGDFREILDRFDPVWSGQRFLVYRRRPASTNITKPAAGPAEADPPDRSGGAARRPGAGATQPSDAR